MSVDLIVELGTEEIPAGFLPPALTQLAALAREGLAASRLECGDVATFGTPRRLVLWVHDVAERQTDVVDERVGPAVTVAFDADGQPTKAAQGFARSAGVEVADLVRVATEKGAYVAARRHLAGRPAAAVLAELVPQWLGRLHFPKSMRWGVGEGSGYARPVHWLLTLLGGEVVACEFAGVESGRASRGHRFHHPGRFDVMDAEDYFRKVRDAGVVIDPAERRRLIAAEVERVAAEAGGQALLDPELLDTVTFLVEQPVPVVGSFEPRYLELPRELLILTMKTHQKYFAVTDESGKLLNHFVTISNTRARDLGVVARGNERVLRARLADARFFYDEDQKVGLEEHVEGLKSVVFQARLGTSHEKVERFRALAGRLAAELCPDRREVVDRIARLCKADLTTQMVYEFPELQGIVGREYALRAGEDPVVAAGIQEHYWPAQAGAALPGRVEADCVSVADKVDTVVGCFGVGLIPTGTADPYALRRQTLGVLRILGEKGYRVGLGWLVDAGLGEVGPKLTRPVAEVRADVLAFFRGRLEGLMTQAGVPADLVSAVLDAGFDDVVDAWSRVRALAEARDRGELAPLAETFKRVANILKGQEPGAPAPEGFAEGAEAGLWDAYRRVQGSMEDALGRGAYGEFLGRAAELKTAVDAFFDAVLVMDPDPAVRANRIALLAAVAGLFRELADFTRVG